MTICSIIHSVEVVGGQVGPSFTSPDTPTAHQTPSLSGLGAAQESGRHSAVRSLIVFLLTKHFL